MNINEFTGFLCGHIKAQLNLDTKVFWNYNDCAIWIRWGSESEGFLNCYPHKGKRVMSATEYSINKYGKVTYGSDFIDAVISDISDIMDEIGCDTMDEIG